MKIALIGGIYDKPQEYRDRFRITPETTLERGFRELGHEVSTFGHDDAPEYGRYDIVHVHHLGRGAVRAAVDRSTTPLVFTLHAFPHRQGSGDAGSHELPVSHKAAMRFVMRRVDGLVSLSSAEQKYLTSTHKLQGVPSAVIPNGIPAGVFRRERVARKDGDPWRLLYVGQLIKNKRVDVLLRAVARLREPFHLKLAYHTAPLEAELMQVASDLGIRDKVEFVGGQTATQLAQLYNEADLFTFPTAHFEALPSVLIEAMLCGTPVVSTDVGGIAELLDGFGRLVPRNAVDALASAIQEMLGQYDKWAAQSEDMSRSARERFSVQTMVARHLEIYSEVIAMSGPRRRQAMALQSFAIPVRALVRRWARA